MKSKTSSFIRAVEDVRGVRIIRLQGPVGMQIGQEEQEAEDASDAASAAFSRPLLLDFKATTAWDSSTIAYLVRALRRRVATHAKVAIINAPPKLLAELEINRLRDMFAIYSSEDEALAKLAEPTNISRAAPWALRAVTDAPSKASRLAVAPPFVSPSSFSPACAKPSAGGADALSAEPSGCPRALCSRPRFRMLPDQRGPPSSPLHDQRAGGQVAVAAEVFHPASPHRLAKGHVPAPHQRGRADAHAPCR
jgi:anti-anti-sigma regulatory factor